MVTANGTQWRTSYSLTDHLGNVRVEFAAHGSAKPNRQLGWYDFEARMYDPMMSSFLSVDRFVQNPETAQGFNRYAYCMHNPLRYVDPSGWEMRKPVLGRTALLKVTKGLGRFCAVTSVSITGYQTVNYYWQGGKGPDVFLKGLGDIGMVSVGVFGGPIGLGISFGYFILDLSTNGFGVSYEINP